jgi:hypothetical protein
MTYRNILRKILSAGVTDLNRHWSETHSPAPANRAGGVICGQTVVLTGITTSASYPDKLRRIKYHDAERTTQREVQHDQLNLFVD